MYMVIQEFPKQGKFGIRVFRPLDPHGFVVYIFVNNIMLLNVIGI